MIVFRCGGIVLKSIILKNEPISENTVDILKTHTRLQPDLASNIKVEAVAENISTFENVKLVDSGNKYVWTEIPSKEDTIRVNKIYLQIIVCNVSTDFDTKYRKIMLLL